MVIVFCRIVLKGCRLVLRLKGSQGETAPFQGFP